MAAAVFGAALAQPAQAALVGAPVNFANAAAQRLVQPSVAASAQIAGAASGAAATAAASTPAGTAAFTVRETTLQTGTVVREYLTSAGTVFGVTWRGPLRPDLAELFGATYFPQFASGVAAASGVRGLATPVSVDTSSLIVQMSGHMGAFVGHAWLPQALPAGVTGSDIR